MPACRSFNGREDNRLLALDVFMGAIRFIPVGCIQCLSGHKNKEWQCFALPPFAALCPLLFIHLIPQGPPLNLLQTSCQRQVTIFRACPWACTCHGINRCSQVVLSRWTFLTCGIDSRRITAFMNFVCALLSELFVGYLQTDSTRQIAQRNGGPRMWSVLTHTSVF